MIKILKAVKEELKIKKVTYQESETRMVPDFSTAILKLKDNRIMSSVVSVI